MMQAAELFEKLKEVSTGVCSYTLERCEEMMPVINDIRRLKREKNAIVLAHTYVKPEIIAGVADEVGDSYYLSDAARKSDADSIIFIAVKFMAETAKILNPHKKVYQPNSNGGCTLADSITGEEVSKLKQKYPDHTFICYINTTAEVKAQCDVCVTSSNVYKIVENIDSDKIFFLPDRWMAQNVIQYLKQRGVEKEILYSQGACYVHETYDPEMLDYLRLKYDDVSIAVHPECTPDVIAKADFVGSTGGIYQHVQNTSHKAYVLVTECGLSSRLQTEIPGKKIVGSCTFCRYMQANELSTVHQVLAGKGEEYLIELDEKVATSARRCIERMFLEVEKSQTVTVG